MQHHAMCGDAMWAQKAGNFGDFSGISVREKRHIGNSFPCDEKVASPHFAGETTGHVAGAFAKREERQFADFAIGHYPREHQEDGQH